MYKIDSYREKNHPNKKFAISRVLHNTRARYIQTLNGRQNKCP